MSLDQDFKAKPKLERTLIILGALCFISQGAFVILHLGFELETNHSPHPIEFLTQMQLWILSSSLGLVGGILLDRKRFLISGLAGILGSLAITGSGLLYFGWRDEALTVEVLIPLLAGLIVGGLTYKFLKQFTEKEEGS